MRRLLYLIAMYSGLRAMSNRVRGAALPNSKLAALDRQLIDLGEFGSAQLRIHARFPCPGLPAETLAGMISLHFLEPGISGLAYRLLRLTSHFGCGHLEIAFYQQRDLLVIYGLRNILRSNLERLRCQKLFVKLKIADERDEIVVFQEILKLLSAHGMAASLASPADCVRLAVDPSLLAPQNHRVAVKSLHRKYSRIWKSVQIHTTPV